MVSEGPRRCAVREGDVVVLQGLQLAELNGRTGIVVSRDGERCGVRLQETHRPERANTKAVKCVNIHYKQPGWLRFGVPPPAGELEAANASRGTALERQRV